MMHILLVLFLFAHGSAQTGSFEEDLESFTRVIESDGDSDSYLLRGIAYYRHGEFEKAQSDFLVADRLGPHQDYVQYWNGCAEFALHNFQAAEPYFERAVQMDPQVWYYHDALAKTRYSLGEIEGAIQSFQSASRCDLAPNYEDVIVKVQTKNYVPDMPESTSTH